MFIQIVIAILFLCILIPFGALYITEKRTVTAKAVANNASQNRKSRAKTALFGNIISFFAVLLFSTVFLFSGSAAAADTASDSAAGLAYIGAALSTGLGSLGAGIATGSAASAALGALSENDGIMGKALIFVALAEGIAIYGLIIAFMILSRV